MRRAREHGKEQSEGIESRIKGRSRLVGAVACKNLHRPGSRPRKGTHSVKSGKTRSVSLAAKEQEVALLAGNADRQAEDFWLETLSQTSQKDYRCTAIVKMEETSVVDKLDTGRNCSVISRSHLQKIKRKQLTNYAAVLNTIPWLSEKKATKYSCIHVTSPEGTFETEFFVVEDDVSVTLSPLSGSVTEKLDLVRRIASLEQHSYDVVKPYEDVFTGASQVNSSVSSTT